jgi:hypothetical protein
MPKKKNTTNPDDWQSDPVVSQTPDPTSNPFDQFDPNAFLASQAQPQGASGGMFDDLIPQAPVQAPEAPPESGFMSGLQNAYEAGKEFVGGMIPRDPYQYMKMLYPPLGAYDAYQHMRQGDFRDVPFLGRIQDIQGAEQTPAWSKERWLAGLKTLADVGILAGAAKGAPEASSADAANSAVRELMMNPEAPTPKSPKASPETGFEFTETGEPMQGEQIPAATEEPILEPLQPVPGSGKFRRSYQVDKELGDLMESIGAAPESGALKGEIAARNLLDELSPEQEGDLGRYLVSRRLKTLNPDHPQILSDAEAQRIESDPAIANALETYKSDIKPDVEALRKRAGLTEEAAAGKEPEFISLIPTTDELLPGTGTPSQAALLSRKTRFAKQASGMAKEYDTNLANILRESYAEAMRKARVNDLYAAAKRKGLTESENFDDLPPGIANDLRAATEREIQPSGAIGKLGRAYQRLTTGLALTANPAELVNHMRRQLNILAAKPPVGRGAARLEALAPYFGPKAGAFARTVMDNMSHPENQAILQDIFDAGGGSARSFNQYKTNVPGIRQLQNATHQLLFGVPKGRGVGGWDLRMRVQLEKIRRAVEGNRDPQRIREFANQIGQYGSHPDWIVKGLRTVNPYAATTLPMRLTELKQAVGTSGLKSASAAASLGRRAETLLRGTGGTLLGLASANYLLSGKYPWENDPGHEFDLNTGTRTKDGKTLYVKLRAIAPELSRPVSTVSAPELSRERTAKHPQYVSAALTGPANQALSLVGGPGQNAALTAMTGKVPYFVKRPGQGPELLDVARLKKGETQQGTSRGLRQIRAAVGGINPVGELLNEPYHVDAPFPLNVIERPLPGVRPFGSIYTQSYERKSR